MSATDIDIETLHEAARDTVRTLRTHISRADADTMRLLLTEARTHYGWQDRPVSEATLRELYDMAKMGPTSMNQQPMRLVFVVSPEAKAKLEPHLMEGNKAKTMSAPVTAIIGNDMAFYEKFPQTFPHMSGAKSMFEGKPALIETSAFRNGTLQAAFLIIAARAVGLDVGPMSGFDNAKVDDVFFAGTTIKSNFLCNLGYADETKIFQRSPRLTFDEVAQIV